MIHSGLDKIYPDRRDYSVVHTFGAFAGDVQGFPDNFSIFDGRSIADQNAEGLPFACTGYSTTTLGGLEDTTTYSARDFYYATPPNDNGGRDIRISLATAKSRGFLLPNGTLGAKKGDYYNCYGSGKIDDFQAVQIALWINQNEKRAASIGSWFYPEFVGVHGVVPTPSFDTRRASLHNWAVTGWKTINGVLYLEALTWQGNYIQYFSREIYNALMRQPYSGAFTLADTPADGVSTVGLTAILDHFVYWFRNTFHV